MALETARKYNGVIYLVFFVRPSAREGGRSFRTGTKKPPRLAVVIIPLNYEK